MSQNTVDPRARASRNRVFFSLSFFNSTPRAQEESFGETVWFQGEEEEENPFQNLDESLYESEEEDFKVVSKPRRGVFFFWKSSLFQKPSQASTGLAGARSRLLRQRPSGKASAFLRLLNFQTHVSKRVERSLPVDT